MKSGARVKPAINEIYHVYNRGVEKREVFIDDWDKKRFLHNLYVFNDNRPIKNNKRLLKEVGLPSSEEREKMVEIMAFTLMQNHYHLMLKQITENGITEFMRKIGTGYTNYFNTKYNRVGPLFQGKYKMALVNNDRHFLFLPHYIHLNPLDSKMPEWRLGRVNNLTAAASLLSSYKWSSYGAYTSIKNLPYIKNLLDLQLIQETHGNGINYKKSIFEWLNKNEIENLKEIILE